MAKVNPGNVTPHQITCEWCNDSMYQLVDDAQKGQGGQSLLHLLMDSNPHLKGYVIDQLEKLAKGSELGALPSPNVLEGTLRPRNSATSLLPETVNVAVLPLFLGGARWGWG